MSFIGFRQALCRTCGKGYHPPWDAGHLFDPPRQLGHLQKVPDDKRAQAVRRCMAGEGFAEVGKDYGVSPSTVRQWCEFHGLEGPWKNELGLRRVRAVKDEARRERRRYATKPSVYSCRHCDFKTTTASQFGRHFANCAKRRERRVS